MEQKKPDPEMLKQLELLLDMDSVDAESDWETLLSAKDLEKEEGQ